MLRDCVKAEDGKSIPDKDGEPLKGKSQLKYPDLDDNEPIHFILKEPLAGEASSSGNAPTAVCLTSSSEGPPGCLEELEERKDVARIQTACHQTQIAKYYNAKVRTWRFNPGDLVLKKVIPSTRNPSSGSLGYNWEGPYIIDFASMRGAYRLKIEDGVPLRNPWNAEHLKKYYQ
ncbi:hypothetical protein EZV62_010377 [Acer yangbiense]|uniref:Reverse transcriptase domain-containing protein n=1 Tax=Acer yangbiense TaxID=1000413 RepID=A0A5C7I1I2_9ROSI|nr:hypothetical protein EZV62_010377 [Acer yangbiense]